MSSTTANSTVLGAYPSDSPLMDQRHMPIWWIAIVLVVSLCNIGLIIFVTYLCRQDCLAKRKQNDQSGKKCGDGPLEKKTSPLDRQRKATTVSTTSWNNVYLQPRRPDAMPHSLRTATLTSETESLSSSIKNSFKKAWSKSSVSNATPTSVYPVALNSSAAFSPPPDNRWSLVIHGASSLYDMPSQNYLDIALYNDDVYASSPYRNASVISNPYATLPRGSIDSTGQSGENNSNFHRHTLQPKSVTRLRESERHWQQNPRITLSSSSGSSSLLDASRSTLMSSVYSESDSDKPLRTTDGTSLSTGRDVESEMKFSQTDLCQISGPTVLQPESATNPGHDAFSPDLKNDCLNQPPSMESNFDLPIGAYPSPGFSENIVESSNARAYAAQQLSRRAVTGQPSMSCSSSIPSEYLCSYPGESYLEPIPSLASEPGHNDDLVTADVVGQKVSSQQCMRSNHPPLSRKQLYYSSSYASTNPPSESGSGWGEPYPSLTSSFAATLGEPSLMSPKESLPEEFEAPDSVDLNIPSVSNFAKLDRHAASSLESFETTHAHSEVISPRQFVATKRLRSAPVTPAKSTIPKGVMASSSVSNLMTFNLSQQDTPSPLTVHADSIDGIDDHTSPERVGFTCQTHDASF